MTRAVALVLFGLALGVAGGCTRPCEGDSDCPSAEHCDAERFCTAACTAAADCASGEQCLRGRCEIGFAPSITWLEPAEGAEVGERFDVVVEVRFRGPELIAVLQRDATEPGEPCAPMVPAELRVEGNIDGESTRQLVFRDVAALGNRFGLELIADARGIEVRHTRGFRGQAQEGFGGAEILTPRQGVLDADDTYTHALQLQLAPTAGLVSGWVEPEGAPPTPRFVLGQGVSEVMDARLPLARGPQVLWLETERAGRVQRCGVGLITAPPAHPGDLELALSFESEAPTDLELSLHAERPGLALETCSVTSPREPCAGVREGPRKLDTYGEEALYLEAHDGTYGLAVAPGAATGPVRATVRLANRGAHLGWLGPRTVQTDRGEVWLAARIYVLGGEVRVEPVDRVVTGMPTEPPTAW